MQIAGYGEASGNKPCSANLYAGSFDGNVLALAYGIDHIFEDSASVGAEDGNSVIVYYRRFYHAGRYN